MVCTGFAPRIRTLRVREISKVHVWEYRFLERFESSVAQVRVDRVGGAHRVNGRGVRG